MSWLRPYLGKEGLLTHVAVRLLALAPPCAAWAALSSRPVADFAAVIVGCVAGIGSMIGRRYQFRDYWALSTELRHSTQQAVRTGETTGDSRLDLIAVRLLAGRAHGFAALRVLMTVGVLVLLTPPVIAAIRLNPLWILADVPVGLVAYGQFTEVFRDPRPRLHALTGRSL
jgi:hypothetical protein